MPVGGGCQTPRAGALLYTMEVSLRPSPTREAIIAAAAAAPMTTPASFFVPSGTRARLAARSAARATPEAGKYSSSTSWAAVATAAAAACVPCFWAFDAASCTASEVNARYRAPSAGALARDRKSTRLNSSHRCISYAVFCLKKKKRWLTQTYQKNPKKQSIEKQHK